MTVPYFDLSRARRRIDEELSRRWRGVGETLPVAEAAAERYLCLPCYPELTDDEVDRVCAAVAGFFAGG